MHHDYVSPAILQNVDVAVSELIAQNRDVSALDGLRLFVASETHRMLEDNSLRMWHFSPLALLDMWETELAMGDPRLSLYLRGDEIG